MFAEINSEIFIFPKASTLVFASVSYFFYACLLFISKQTMLDYASSFKENVRNDDENYFVSGKRPSSIIWNCIIGLLIQMYRAQKTLFRNLSAL